MPGLRVLQVQTQAEAAGAQRVSDLVAEGLRQRGHQVRTVFMYRKTAAYDHDPDATFVSETEPANFLERLRTALRLFTFVQSQKPEVLITYQHYGNIIGALAGRFSSASLIVANQSGNPSSKGLKRCLGWVDRLFGALGVYDFIVVNSGSTEALYRQFSPRYAKRLVRIEHGVRMPQVEIEKERARALFGLPTDGLVLVTSGRLAPGKNQSLLIRSLQLLPRAHLALAGAGPDRENLEELTATLQLRDRVHFIGELSSTDLEAFLQAGDIFVFASTDETFGMSVVEASSAGLPVVTTDLPVFRELLTDDEGRRSALLFHPGDCRSLAQKITAVLNDPGLAEELRSAGRSVGKRYSVERMVGQYGYLIEQRTCP